MEQSLQSLLNASTQLGRNHVKPLHALVVKNPTATPLFLRRLLSPATLAYALQVFDAIPLRDPVLANAIISTCSRFYLHRKALAAFFLARNRGTHLPFFSFPPAIKACALLPAPREGEQLHSAVVANGFFSNSFIQVALVDFYSKINDPASARKVFDSVPAKDPILFNSLISCYSRAGNTVAARQLFDAMEERTLVSWNSMLSCYARSNCMSEGVQFFERMRLEGVEPNEITLVTVLSICAKLGDLQLGLKVKELVDLHPRRNELIVRTAVLEMLVKGGAIEDARNEFEQMDNRDVIAWSAMISGYTQNGRPAEALHLFDRMVTGNFKPNEITLVSVIAACSQLGSVDIGNRIGSYVETQGFLSDMYVSSALLDMYAKCGNIERARDVFKAMHKKDVVSWNSMISGLAYNGYAVEAISLYEGMIDENVEPTDLTFIGLLTACSHAGFVELGFQYYDCMEAVYGIVPKVEHCACVVDLLCRLGRLRDAYDFVCKMEVEPNVVIWGSLLSACRISPNIELAELAMEKLMILEPYNSANYVILSNLYADAGRWKDAFKMRNLMKEKHVPKLAAYSWIEVDNLLHKFLVGDASHPMCNEIYRTIEKLVLLENWQDTTLDFDIVLD